jgi:hypothetical protein
MAPRTPPDVDRNKLIPLFELDGLYGGCLTLSTPSRRTALYGIDLLPISRTHWRREYTLLW